MDVMLLLRVKEGRREGGRRGGGSESRCRKTRLHYLPSKPVADQNVNYCCLRSPIRLFPVMVGALLFPTPHSYLGPTSSQPT